MTARRLRLLEIATAWPIVYMAIFLAFWLASVMSIVGLGVAAPAGNPTIAGGLFAGGVAVFGVILVLHVFTMVLSVGLMGLHAWLAIARHADRSEGLLWALLCFLGGPIGQLLHIHFALRPQIRAELGLESPAGG